MKYFSFKIPGYTIDPPANLPSSLTNGYSSLQSIIQTGITFLFVFTIILTIIFILYSGIAWITSGGDKEKLQKARARLTYSIIGLLVLAFSFFIVRTVVILLGGNPDFFLNTNTP